jgi:hypothetical protein
MSRVIPQTIIPSRTQAASIQSRSSDAAVLVGLDAATPGIDRDHALYLSRFAANSATDRVP